MPVEGGWWNDGTPLPSTLAPTTTAAGSALTSTSCNNSDSTSKLQQVLNETKLQMNDIYNEIQAAASNARQFDQLPSLVLKFNLLKNQEQAYIETMNKQQELIKGESKEKEIPKEILNETSKDTKDMSGSVNENIMLMRPPVKGGVLVDMEISSSLVRTQIKSGQTQSIEDVMLGIEAYCPLPVVSFIRRYRHYETPPTPPPPPSPPAPTPPTKSMTIACPNCETKYELLREELFCGILTCHCFGVNSKKGGGTMFQTEAVAQYYREHEGKKFVEMMRHVLPPNEFAQLEIDATMQYVTGLQIPQHMTMGTAAGLKKDLGVTMTPFQVDEKTMVAKIHHFVPDSEEFISSSDDDFHPTGGSVLDWQNSTLPNSYPPTEIMMRWMSNYVVPCHRMCCLSEDCGTIKCDGCRRKLTTIPPLDRFECTECPWLGSDIRDDYQKLAEKLRTTRTDPRPTYCKECFHNPNIAHPHTKFLSITPDGHHAFITRDSACVVPVRELRLDDFPVIQATWPVGKECQSYCCENEDPPAALPGCKQGHGMPSTLFDSKKQQQERGVVDSEEYMCAPCQLASLKGSGDSTILAAAAAGSSLSLQFCDVCAQEAEVTSFVIEFEQAKQRLAEMVKEAEAGEGGEMSVAAMAAELNGMLGTKLGMMEDGEEEELELEEKKKGGGRATITLDAMKRELLRLHPQPWLHVEIEKM